VLILVPGGTRPSLALKPPAVEFRLDLFESTKVARAALDREIEVFRDAGSLLLVTARRKADGGRWKGCDEEARRAALLRYAPLADAVDLEADLLSTRDGAEFVDRVRSKLKRRSALLLSQHEFRRMLSNSELESLRRAGGRLGATRLKVAAMAKSAGDAERLARWAVERSSKELPITAVAMGPSGSWTRWVLPRLLGGPAYAPYGRAVAPGQISYGEMVALLGAGSP
jgi:3-dehydroquinate dehydratase type I